MYEYPYFATYVIRGKDGKGLLVAERLLYQIGADYLLGRWEDDFDVQYVRMYTLLKP